MKPFLYVLITFLFVSCSSISTPCYFGALPQTQEDKFNESISEILQKASSNEHFKTLTHEDYISYINSDLQISDTLAHPVEIRIYKMTNLQTIVLFFECIKQKSTNGRSFFMNIIMKFQSKSN